VQNYPNPKNEHHIRDLQKKVNSQVRIGHFFSDLKTDNNAVICKKSAKLRTGVAQNYFSRPRPPAPPMNHEKRKKNNAILTSKIEDFWPTFGQHLRTFLVIHWGGGGGAGG